MFTSFSSHQTSTLENIYLTPYLWKSDLWIGVLIIFPEFSWSSSLEESSDDSLSTFFFLWTTFFLGGETFFFLLLLSESDSDSDSVSDSELEESDSTYFLLIIFLGGTVAGCLPKGLVASCFLVAFLLLMRSSSIHFGHFQDWSCVTWRALTRNVELVRLHSNYLLPLFHQFLCIQDDTRHHRSHN